MSYNKYQQKGKSDFDDPKYCSKECGKWIWFINPSGEKWIPGDYGTQNPHECKRNERSPAFDPTCLAVEESNGEPKPATIHRGRKKQTSYQPATTTTNTQQQQQQQMAPNTGISSEQINHILTEVNDVAKAIENLRGTLESQVLANQRYHTQLLELVAEALKPGPQSALDTLNQEYQKTVSAVTGKNEIATEAGYVEKQQAQQQELSYTTATATDALTRDTANY